MFDRKKDFKLIYKDPKLDDEAWERKWLDMRMGRFTASQIYRLMTDNKTKGFKTYVREIVQEIVTGISESFKSEHTENGNVNEVFALRRYMKKHDTVLTTKTFIKIGDHAGCSPDGIDTLPNILVEAKCPKFKNHVKYVLMCIEKNLNELKVDHKNHYWQIQMNLLGLGYDKAKFITYFPPHWMDHKVKDYAELIVPAVEEDQKKLVERIKLATEYKLELLDKMGYKAA